MGRQAHLTRLALGRSPYGDPLKDENGDFVMLSKAGIYNNNGYRQNFDERGHPKNRESTLALTRFWRAQNNVLAFVGVVARRENAQKSKWERLESDQRRQIVKNENGQGQILKAIDRIVGAMSFWPLNTLRWRMMTFDPYYKISLLELIRNEWASFGSRSFMTDGQPTYLLSCLLQRYRHYVRNPNVEDIVNYVDPTKYKYGLHDMLTYLLLHTPAFIIELPLQIYAILQGLFIIRTDDLINVSFFVPFTRASPIFLPPLPTSKSLMDLPTFILNCVQTPLMLSMIRDYLHAQIGFRLYALLRQVLIRPDDPDVLSTDASDENELLDDLSIPGVGRPRNTRDLEMSERYFGPRSFMGALRIAFPLVYKILNFLSRDKISRSRGRLNPKLEDQLQIQVKSAYCGRLRTKGEAPTPGSIADIALRREVMYHVFSASSLDPDEELVDPYAWADAVLQDVVTLSSNSTPDPQELRNFAEHMRQEAQSLIDPYRSADGNERMQAADVVTSIEVELLSDTALEQPHFHGSENPSRSPQTTMEGSQVHDSRITTDTQNESVRHINGTMESASSHTDPTSLALENTLLNNSRPAANLLNNDEPYVSNAEEATAIVDHVENEESQTQTPHSTPDPPTPIQELFRAESLTNVNPAPTRHRPLRRPTDIGQSAAQNPLINHHNGFFPESNAFSDIFNPYLPSESDLDEDALPFRRRSHRGYNYIEIPERRKRRVTTLSTYSADSLAWHTSAIVTNLILWPLESLYIRSITIWFLTNPVLSTYVDRDGILGPMNSTVFGGALRVFGIRDWFGGAGNGMSKLEYLGRGIMLIGLEAVGRGFIWYLGTKTSIEMGQESGWGKF